MPLRLLLLLLTIGGEISLRAQMPLKEEVIYSRGGGLLTGQVTLGIASPTTSGAVIHYTLDNSEPTAASPIWTHPLAINQSAAVRARVVGGDGSLGPVKSRQYLRLDDSLLHYQGQPKPFSSNLPLIIVGAFSGSIEDHRQPESVYAVTLLPGASGRASITGAPEYQGRGTMHQHGETSAYFDQNSYSWETTNEEGSDKSETILGMPEESDWVLYAPYNDKTLMRNLLVYSRMRELRGEGSAMRTKFCEVFVSHDPAKPVSMADYRGLYVLVEKIKRDKNRVDIAKLETTDTDPALISGGYILRKDKPDEAFSFTTALGQVDLQVKEPSAPNPAQQEYLQGYFNDFEAALAGDGFTDPSTGYAAYIDPETFIDNQWFVEITKNVDGYRYSSYFSKDRGRRLQALPLWDFNIALGNANYLDGDKPTGWYYENAPEYPWYPRLHQDPLYDLQYWDRYWVMRRGVFSTANLAREILRQQKLLLGGRTEAVTNQTPLAVQSPAARHFRRWPVLGKYVAPNADGYDKRKSFQSEVAAMVRFINQRLAWIDQQNQMDGAILVPPKLSRPAGQVKLGAKVMIASSGGLPPAGLKYATGTIYYTTDGRDPRAEDGTAQGSAYTQPVAISATLTLKARLLAGTHWSPIVEATYVAGAAAASARNVVVSEIMYHAAKPSSAEMAAGVLEGSDFDWIELANPSTAPVDLTGLRFHEGIDFDFATAPAAVRVLQPGAAAVLVARRVAFRLRYPGVPASQILGEYTHSLANDGERVTLSTKAGAAVADFAYSDQAPWPVAADGTGKSLEVIDPRSHPALSKPQSWQASTAARGTPGTW